MKLTAKTRFLLICLIILSMVFSLRISAETENNAAVAQKKIRTDWTFNKDDSTEGWAEVRGSLTEIKVKEGVLSMTISGEDPLVS